MLIENINNIDELINFKINAKRYSQISFKGASNCVELTSLAEEQNLGDETKKAIELILKFAQDNKINIEITTISQIFKLIIKNLLKSGDNNKKYLAQRLVDLEKIKSLSESNNIDHLTGLHNRKQLEFELEQLSEKYTRYSAEYSVLVIDIDKFKNINDTFLHEGGDKVLKEISKIFISNIRTTDTAYRFGGEEFVIVLENTSHKDALTKAEKIRKIIEIELINSIKEEDNIFMFCKDSIGGECFQSINCDKSKKGCFSKNITCSIGVSTIGKEDGITEGNNHLISRADSAMYKAKQTGRNKVVSGQDIDLSIINEDVKNNQIINYNI